MRDSLWRDETGHRRHALYRGGAIAFIATAVASTTTSVALATALYFGVTVGAYAAIAVGALFLQRALLPRQEQPKPEDVQQSFRQGVQPRIVHYGVVKTSGPWLFAGTYMGSYNKVIALMDGEISEILEYWIDDNAVTLNGSGEVTTAKYVHGGAPAVVIKTQPGTDSQTAFSTLVGRFSEFTSAHRGRGITMLLAVQNPVSQEDYYETFPNGINTLYRVVAKGKAVWSPITETTAWNDNAAMIIRDFMTSEDGMRLPEAIFTTTQAQAGWEAAVTECVSAIDLNAGGTEPQFRIWGSYSMQERPGDVLARMLAACDGRIVPTSDGGVTLKIATGAAPAVTLDEDSILDVSEMTRGLDREQRPNTIRTQFLDAGSDYSSADADPWIDASDIAARGVEPDDSALLMVPSHTQCRRLMKRRFYRLNPAWTMRITTNLKGMACIGEEAVTLQLADFGIDDRFEIQNLEFNFRDGNILEGVTLDLIAMPAAAFAWDETLEEGTPPGATIVAETSSIPTPDAPTVTYNVGTQVLEVDGDALPSPALGLEFRIKPTAGSDWANFAPPFGDTTSQVSGLLDGTEYEVQARYKTLTLKTGAWSSSATITITTDETAPNDVTLNSAVGGSGEATLNWTAPNSANFNRVVITRNTANDEGTAVAIPASPVYGVPNGTYEISDDDGGTLAADDYYYWIYAQNGSGVDDGSGVATGAVTVS